MEGVEAHHAVVVASEVEDMAAAATTEEVTHRAVEVTEVATEGGEAAEATPHIEAISGAGLKCCHEPLDRWTTYGFANHALLCLDTLSDIDAGSAEISENGD